jgi:dolichol-phosphate mannosyltransferase
MHLAVVIPVYNEERNITALLNDWRPVFEATGVGYRVILIDDGSTDKSLSLLQTLQGKDPCLSVHTQPNSGHGPAVLRGYRMAVDAAVNTGFDAGFDADWVFQIDSDHQLEPATFGRLWKNKEAYDLLLAQRQANHSSATRGWLSKASAATVQLLYGAKVKDANCPYRLMRGTALQQALKNIPPKSFAPNILLTSWFIRKKSRIFTTVVEHRKESMNPSRMSGYIMKGALISGLQTILFRLRS